MDNDTDQYEDWPGVSNLRDDVTDYTYEPAAFTANKSPPPKQSSPNSTVNTSTTVKEQEYMPLTTAKEQEIYEETETAFQQLIRNKQNTTATNEESLHEPKMYYPTTDDDVHSKSDHPHHGDDSMRSKSDHGDVNDNVKLKSDNGTVFKSSELPTTSNVTLGGTEIHNGLSVAAKVSSEDKDNDITERSQDLSMSNMANVSELLQSVIAERESFVKVAEAQKSQLESDLVKTHELEMKELHLKYKSKIKKLQLKQKEEGIAMKVVVEKLQSELTGVYKQNSKLTYYVKKSCKREERFNRVVAMLQDTVSSLESELTEVRQEVVALRKRENELLASLELSKEKLKKFEAT